jgi:hypothetical protein
MVEADTGVSASGLTLATSMLSASGTMSVEAISSTPPCGNAEHTGAAGAMAATWVLDGAGTGVAEQAQNPQSSAALNRLSHRASFIPGGLP